MSHVLIFYKRALLDLILFSCVLFAPILVTSICAIAGLFFFVGYGEAIIAALCIDTLYMGGAFMVDERSTAVFPMTLYAVCAFIIVGLLRKKIRESY